MYCANSIAIRVAACAAACVLAWTNAAAADPEAPLPPEIYRLQQSEPSTGTRIPRTNVSGLQVPLNRRYDQLTEAQKQIVKRQYEPMPETDGPPFPVDGLAPLMRAAQQIIQLTQESDTLTLVANVDATGNATSVEVLMASGAVLARRVAGLLMVTKYKPAVCAGIPCAMKFPLRFAARIER